MGMDDPELNLGDAVEAGLLLARLLGAVHNGADVNHIWREIEKAPRSALQVATMAAVIVLGSLLRDGKITTSDINRAQDQVRPDDEGAG